MKLTPGQVEEIRRRGAAGESPAALGREFGCTGENVSHILRGRWWRSPGAAPIVPVRREPDRSGAHGVRRQR